jgi:UDP-glucose 4-epimerase
MSHMTAPASLSREAADNRDLNYDRYFVEGAVRTEADESYTSHNTRLLDVDGVVEKLLTTDYVRKALGRA